MSLAFLSKKGWHTSNLQNVEKVWIAEQKQEKEAKRVLELQKQIEEERQIDDLRALQRNQGLVTDPREKLEWMYEGPSSGAGQDRESVAQAAEYKRGKEYKPSAEQSDVKAMEAKKKEHEEATIKMQAAARRKAAKLTAKQIAEKKAMHNDNREDEKLQGTPRSRHATSKSRPWPRQPPLPPPLKLRRLLTHPPPWASPRATQSNASSSST